MTLRVALAGCGVISVQHLEAITAAPGAELVAVCDTDPERARTTALQHRCREYGDFEQMLDVERPDVVHVCTPHFRHAPMAIAALGRNVNVLLEKPLATTVADGEAVARAARTSPAILGVCYQNRYNNTARAMRDLIDGGTLGRPRGGRATVNWFRDNGYYSRSPWRGTWARGGGGVLINQSIHTLDLLQWFLGDVVEIRGRADRLALDDPVEVEDTANIVLRHHGGVGSIFHATNAYVDDASVMVEVLTEHARVRLEKDLIVTSVDGTTRVIPEEGTATGAKAYWGLSHALLIEDFYRHVEQRRPFWIDAEEALKTLRIVTSVYRQSDCPPSPDRVSLPMVSAATGRSGPYSGSGCC
ncbi:putative dehydrogenase [Nakamurella sp. UYEF19]|uniref:Gfo/Idh/MocA family protein n=1 Tax=Nakamurella sp. UYEF19 TaxID=1756392 RepID=UPI0033957D7F